MVSPDAIALLLGRILISGVFIFSAWGKLLSDPIDVAAITSLGLPHPQMLGRAVGVCEVIGALMLTLGAGARVAAVLLSIFLLSVTLAFLRFWKATDHPARFAQANSFFGNLGVLGGLVYITVMGPGSLALSQTL